MLGARTKQITTYGKRRQRIVNDDDRLPRPPPSIFDDLPPIAKAPLASRMKKRENHDPKPKSKSKTPSPKILHVSKKRVVSPQRKVLPQIRRLEEVEGFTPSRKPLGVRPLNTPASVNKGKRLSGSPPLKSFASKIEILVLDDQGKTVSKEHRISKRAVVIDTDDEEEYIPQPKPPRRLRQVASQRIDSDESESDSEVLVVQPPLVVKDSIIDESQDMSLELEVVISPEPPLSPKPIIISVPLPAKTPLTPPRHVIPSQTYQHVPSPIPRARPLTPIRGRALGLRAPPSPPSPLTSEDGNFDISLSDLTDCSDVLSSVSSQEPAITTPQYLQPLLAECRQTALHEFSAFIKSFPFDPLVSGHREASRGFKKIGEASYSEVYGIGQVVLKVIPLRDDSQRRLRQVADDTETPFATDVKDVLKEIIVTEAMGELRGGFVKLLRTYIVRGRYPQQLLELWDEYNERVGSEGIRPDTFAVSQAYAIIVLPNGGPDLEAYTFAAKNGWKQACSIFWQVAKTLGHAEQLVSFEHRDLHLGQILVKEETDAVVTKPLQAMNLNQKPSKHKKPMMDDPIHGVRATVIDLGLSRMDAGDGSGGETVHWTPFEEEIFEGEGDYQFDIYRYMRDHNGDNWEAFSPLTNSLWLHYLVVKLLKSKGLRAPTRRKSQAPTPPSSGYTDRECYECLLDMEEWLGHSIAGIIETSKGKSKSRGRKKKVAPPAATPAGLLRGPLCAGEVVEYGVKKGWIETLVLG
ncbi:Other/Haspin protein kinase [Mycena indigotica]|uniref:non-specific serine/threonine protein kinase n=1 Tax=Mycena indigotica TaxID=2126181 RepID=A0A8H6SM41_9AGAR|nr:Other/Haspin protein kinase [Mycena indigotica]KAF7301926.1 Other/Haspin protein kinase [Mycena indigotica]